MEKKRGKKPENKVRRKKITSTTRAVEFQTPLPGTLNQPYEHPTMKK